MRNLLFFIYKYYTFLLFFGLEIFAIIILNRFNTYHRASFLNQTSAVTSGFFESVGKTKNYFNLGTINDSLMAENARLREELLYSLYSNHIAMNKVRDTIYKQQYEYIAAEIVNNSVTRRNNYITLNKGSLHGIEPEMGVMSANGVVGIVMTVSDHYSVVLSLLNGNCKISAKLRKDNAFGSCVWDGIDSRYARVLDVNKHVTIAVDDQIETSGYSTIFPEGIAIGKIYSHSLDAGDNFHTIKVELATDFATVKNVYVIRNLMKAEQKNLETKTYKSN